jgi:DNA-binding XRE family transcriptional regulator
MVQSDLVAMVTSAEEARRKRKVNKRAAPGGILTLLGQELRRRRHKKKLTQVDLSVEAGLSPNLVGLIERGIYNPTIVVLHAIATRLDIRVKDLFPDTGFSGREIGLQHENNFPTA